MMTVVGIDFTDYTIQNLRRRGFMSMDVEACAYHDRYSFPLSCEDTRFAGFEIHVVHEEREYLAFAHRNHFFPYVRDDAPIAAPLPQPNGANTLGHILSYDRLGDSPLGRYLSIRKGFEIPALLLRCRDIETFDTVAKPDLEFFDEDGEVGHDQRSKLIHLGPSCFDLIVVQT